MEWLRYRRAWKMKGNIAFFWVGFALVIVFFAACTFIRSATFANQWYYGLFTLLFLTINLVLICKCFVICLRFAIPSIILLSIVHILTFVFTITRIGDSETLSNAVFFFVATLSFVPPLLMHIGIYSNRYQKELAGYVALMKRSGKSRAEVREGVKFVIDGDVELDEAMEAVRAGMAALASPSYEEAPRESARPAPVEDPKPAPKEEGPSELKPATRRPRAPRKDPFTCGEFFWTKDVQGNELELKSNDGKVFYDRDGVAYIRSGDSFCLK